MVGFLENQNNVQNNEKQAEAADCNSILTDNSIFLCRKDAALSFLQQILLNINKNYI